MIKSRIYPTIFIKFILIRIKSAFCIFVRSGTCRKLQISACSLLSLSPQERRFFEIYCFCGFWILLSVYPTTRPRSNFKHFTLAQYSTQILQIFYMKVTVLSAFIQIVCKTIYPWYNNPFKTINPHTPDRFTFFLYNRFEFWISYETIWLKTWSWYKNPLKSESRKSLNWYFPRDAHHKSEGGQWGPT